MTEEKRKLLENKEVIEEIKRHLWIESEKAGYDIGFEKAAEDWITRFSDDWVKYNLSHNGSPEKKTRTKRTTILKTRRASSYV